MTMYVEITDDQYDTLRKLGMYIKKFDLDAYVKKATIKSNSREGVLKKVEEAMDSLGERYYYLRGHYSERYTRSTFGSISISKIGNEFKIQMDSGFGRKTFKTEEEARLASLEGAEKARKAMIEKRAHDEIKNTFDEVEYSIDELYEEGIIGSEKYEHLKENGIRFIKCPNFNGKNSNKENKIKSNSNSPR